MSLTDSLPSVRIFTDADEYHYTVENRVAGDLAARDTVIAARVDALTSTSVQNTSNGFNVTMQNSVPKLILDAASSLTTGTVVLPNAPIDVYEVTIVCTNSVATFTLSPYTGHTIKNAVTSLAAGVSVKYTFIASSNTWYRT